MSIVPYRKVTRDPSTYAAGLNDFDRIFDNLFRNALSNSAPAASASAMALKMNVSETDKAYLVDVELPGIDEKDVDLSLKEGVLTISGEKHQEEVDEGKTFHRVEHSYGSFKRSLQLPADADEAKIEATMKNGVLGIEIAKLKEAQKEPRRISIKKK